MPYKLTMPASQTGRRDALMKCLKSGIMDIPQTILGKKLQKLLCQEMLTQNGC